MYAFISALALNAFTTLLLRTQDPGNDSTLVLSCAVLAAHTLALLQLVVPCGVYVYVQWACSAPLLWWLLSQLLGTLPPVTWITAQKLKRWAVMEVGAALLGLVTVVAVDMPAARLSIGLVLATGLGFELLPLALPLLSNLLRPASSSSGSSSNGGGSGNGGGGGGGSSHTSPANSGSASSSRAAAAAALGGMGRSRGLVPTVGSGTHGGGPATAAGGPQTLPAPMEALLCVMVLSKLLQALAAAAVSYGSPGRGLELMSGPQEQSRGLAWALWLVASALALYGLPLAAAMYYGLVRYAASMLVVRRTAFRRASSLGLDAALADWQQQHQQVGGRGGSGAGGGGGGGGGGGPMTPPSRSRLQAAACGHDSDSDAGGPFLPSRLLELGDLYRITEGSETTSSGDEGWRGDVALMQLLFMARTTFKGQRSSTDLPPHERPGAVAGGSSGGVGGSGGAAGGHGAGGGGAGGGGGSGGAASGSWGEHRRSPLVPVARPSPVMSTTACQTDPLPEPAAAAAAAAASSATPSSAAPPPLPPRPPRAPATTASAGLQCDLGPPTVTVTKEVLVEVPVPVPAPEPAAAAAPPPRPASLADGALVALLVALREHSSDIAHDMKNPLNGVLALSQNVIQGTFGELPQVAADQLGVVRACAYHLLNMINQLRDCLKMLHGGEPEFNCGRVQLGNAIDEVLKRMSPMVGSRLAVKAEHDPAALVFADDTRLYQSVHTVLANAFKYTRKGGVTIDTLASADKTTVTLRVSDTGSGFSQEQLEKFNSPLTGSPAEQLGLGLTMVKRTMALFGGTMRLSNRNASGGAGSGGGGLVELTFRTKEDVPPLGAGLPPPPSLPPAVMPMAAPLPGGGGAAAATSVSASAAPSTAAAAAADGAAAVAPPPPRKTRRSIMGSGAAGGMEDRLAAANSSNDAPRSAAGGGGGAAASSATAGGAAAASGGAGAAGLTGAGVDDALFLNKSGEEAVRVLIVDDDPVNLTILEDLLRSEGYDVLTAASGTEALETYLTSDPQPKLVLLDVTLPDMSGHEVCLKMRSLTPGVPPPIIMISGKASTKDVIKGLQAGACDYITKPFQPQEVMARVETQLRLFMGEVAQLQEAAERNMALLRQILPPHILAPLRGGTRVLVEKFADVAVLCADVVGFSSLAASADTADCIMTLNRLFSTFDALTDKHGVHKMDCHTDSYVAALGHMPQDRHISNVMQIKVMLDLAREMLAAVDGLPYPDTLGKMQIRIGIHVGAIFGGVIGVKYPRYSLFGTTLRLAQGLQATALPNTIHVSEVVHNRVRAAGGETFSPYTTVQVQSLGIIRTYLAGPSTAAAAADGGGAASTGMLDFSQLDPAAVLDYLRGASLASHGASGLTVLSCQLAGGAALSGGAGLFGGGGGGAMGMGGGAAANAAAALAAAALARTASSARTTATGVSSAAAGSGGGGGGAAGGVQPLTMASMPLAAAPPPAAAAAGGGAGGLQVRTELQAQAATGLAGASAAAPPPAVASPRAAATAAAPYKIIPMVSSPHVGAGAGDAPVGSRESDAGSGYAITLGNVAGGLAAGGGAALGLGGGGGGGDQLMTTASVDMGSSMSTNESGMATAGAAAAAAGLTPPTAASGSVGSISSGAAAIANASHAAVAGYVSFGGLGGGGGGGGGGIVSAASLAPAAGSHAALAAGGGSNGSGKRYVSEASLVQDLSPGPPAAGLGSSSRIQRMHGAAGPQQQPLAAAAAAAAAAAGAAPGGAAAAPGSGLASPVPRTAGASGAAAGSSRSGSRGPSRNTSFRLGGGASPLAATVMQQQLLSALQQQQAAAAAAAAAASAAAAGPLPPSGGHMHLAAVAEAVGGDSAATTVTVEDVMLNALAAEAAAAASGVDTGGTGDLGHESSAPGFASEPLFRVHSGTGGTGGTGTGGAAAGGGAERSSGSFSASSNSAAVAAAGFGAAAAAAAGGMSAAVMRRLGGVPPKAASLGSIGLMGHTGVVFYGQVSSAGAAAGGSAGGTPSAAGSASSAAMLAGAASVGGGVGAAGGGAGAVGSGVLLGSGTSSPQFLSPGATRSNLLVPPAGSAAAAAAAAAAALAASSGAYAGLSDETRARLARLRGNSAADLHDSGAAGGGAAAAGISGAAPPPGRLSFASPVAVDTFTAGGGGGGGTPFAAAGGDGSRQPSLGRAPATWGSSAGAALGSPGGGIIAAAASGALGSGAAGAAAAAPVGNLSSPPETVTALLESLGLGHYAKSIAGAVPGGLQELGALDDGGLRKVGLVSSRSRQLVQEELRRWGYRG
ncbi:hypothetical protein HYH02_010070 [Chlamydomonas schloesseri]|uniref:histidine kinase n=1 Tax=Chlamydomonas schloesseri TaxID=2026947 RepID=A0A835TCN9_9CHLO|nr:hypothetical protein HYH02_010070 [Chlamydomonas schloesseri]|eukprot:KAG2441227.1 hypothetical protein HYH02_010070 [Chlamydomonas schloesseri]